MRIICGIVKIIAIIMLILCLLGKMDYKLLLIVGTILCILEKKVVEDKNSSKKMKK